MELVQYEPIRARISELVANNASLTFDYASDKGNKLARSQLKKNSAAGRRIGGSPKSWS
jgi:hypothetical protein